MGTDIHLFVERRTDRRRRVHGIDRTVWECVPPPARDLARWPLRDPDRGYWGPADCMYDDECYDCRGGGCADCCQTGRDLQWYGNRNYEVFGVLAGVRGHDQEPIVEPRGKPDDISDEVDRANVDSHSYSWLLLPEVLIYDWDQTWQDIGVLPLRPQDASGWGSESFAEWAARGGGQPRSWSGGCGGHDAVTVEPDVARGLLARPSGIDPTKRYHVRVAWTASLRDRCVDFIAFVDEIVRPLDPGAEDLLAVYRDAAEAGRTDAMPALREQILTASRIRLVFGFGS